jgi:hypothetical protein
VYWRLLTHVLSARLPEAKNGMVTWSTPTCGEDRAPADPGGRGYVVGGRGQSARRERHPRGAQDPGLDTTGRPVPIAI